MVERLLLKAANILRGPENYNRHSTDAAIDPFAKQFHLSSVLERANLRHRSGHVPVYGDPANVVKAKELLCRRLGVMHLMIWEQQEKPDWLGVKAMLLDATNG